MLPWLWFYLSALEIDEDEFSHFLVDIDKTSKSPLNTHHLHITQAFPCSLDTHAENEKNKQRKDLKDAGLAAGGASFGRVLLLGFGDVEHL